MKTINTKLVAVILLFLTFVSVEVFGSTITKSDHYPVIEEYSTYKKWSDYLDYQMNEFVSENNIPNAVISLVCADHIHLMKGYGYADFANQIPVDPEKHLFRIGSVSKIFTWVAVLQLYEQGLVDLNADINKYLDIEFNQKILYKTSELEPITLYHLITHTAGFEDVLEGIFSFKPLPSLKQQLMHRVPARIFPPGEIMAYSNWGTSLAGYIVEQVSGLSYEEYVRQNIFLKMGMTRSSFQQPLPGELKPLMVNSYRWVNGEFLKGNFEHIAAPAGGMSTSAYDMALFLQAHLNGGSNIHGEILQPETMEKMHAPNFRYHQLLSGMTYGMIESNINGYRIVAHAGSSSIFDAGFYLIPELSTGLFIAYSGGDYTGHIRILQDFMDEFFPYTESYVSNIDPIEKVSISDLKGEYHQSRCMITSSDRILNLIIGSLRLKPMKENQMKFSLYGTYFEFEELSPGVFRNTENNNSYPFGSMEYILASRTSEGRLMLVTDGPMTFIKTRWYETASFAGIIFIPALILMVLSLSYFLIRLIYRKIRKNTKVFSKNVRLVNKIICLHSLVFITTILLFLLNTVPHHVHLLPKSFFEPNPFLDAIITGGFFITGIAGIIVAISIIRIWIKESKVTFIKLYQSIYALWALGLVWVLSFYNFLGF